MRFPTVSRKNAQQLVDELRERADGFEERLSTLTDESAWVSEKVTAQHYDRIAVDQAARQLREELWPVPVALSQEARRELEATMAGRVHAVLHPLPVEVLQDRDFWRYLALFPFRWYLLAREPELSPQDFGGQQVLVDEFGAAERIKGTDMRHQLLLRTYLWGQCAFDDKDTGGRPGEFYRRARSTLDVQGLSTIDVWHSHMVRVQLGQLGRIPLAFIDAAVSVPLSTDDARELEKLLTRMKHTIQFDVYGSNDAERLMTELAPKAVQRAAARRASRVTANRAAPSQ